MITKPDCWQAQEYDKSFGPRSQWNAIKRLYNEEDLSEEDGKWLDQTTSDEVDGRMREILDGWHYARKEEPEDSQPTQGASAPQVSVVAPPENLPAIPEPSPVVMNAAGVIGQLFTDIDCEIDAIKTGTLSTQKASEVAKFRLMQIRSMELILQAGHLEVKLRDQSKRLR